MVRRFADSGSEPGQPHTDRLVRIYQGGGIGVGRSGKAPNVRWRVENSDKTGFVS